jgi:membrane associated rhomboid family serine protease
MGRCGKYCCLSVASLLWCFVLFLGGWLTFPVVVVTFPELASNSSVAERLDPQSGMYPLLQRGSFPVFLQAFSGQDRGLPDGSAIGSGSVAFLAAVSKRKGSSSAWMVAPLAFQEGKVWALTRVNREGGTPEFVQSAVNSPTPDSGKAAWCCGKLAPVVRASGVTPERLQGTNGQSGAAAGGKQVQAELDGLGRRPVDLALMLLCGWLFFRQSTGRLPQDRVWISLELVGERQEGWRALTSALSHGSLMHIGFNLLTLFQLELLEKAYGSFRYASTSLALVVWTSAVACVLQWGLSLAFSSRGDATRAEAVRKQPAVGYSAVIFAWIVMVSSQQESYCPLPILNQVCLPTWRLALPQSSFLPPDIPLNLAPFLLLLFTQLIIPNASFTGHLAGILVGYPLAWGAFDWLPNPTVLVVALWVVFGWALACANRPASAPAGWTGRSSMEAAPAWRTAIIWWLFLSRVALWGASFLVFRWWAAVWSAVPLAITLGLLPAVSRLSQPPFSDPTDDSVWCVKRASAWRAALRSISSEFAVTSVLALAVGDVLAQGNTLIALSVLAPCFASWTSQAAVGGAVAVTGLALLASLGVAWGTLKLMGDAGLSGPMYWMRCAYLSLFDPQGVGEFRASEADARVWKEQFLDLPQCRPSGYERVPQQQAEDPSFQGRPRTLGAAMTNAG